jgi:hypothetical protein
MATRCSTAWRPLFRRYRNRWPVLLKKHIRSEKRPPLPNLAIAIGDRSQNCDQIRACARKIPYATAESMGGVGSAAHNMLEEVPPPRGAIQPYVPTSGKHRTARNLAVLCRSCSLCSLGSSCCDRRKRRGTNQPMLNSLQCRLIQQRWRTPPPARGRSRPHTRLPSATMPP